jgi:glycosyltransferase involved in cell wall biosynthesis
VLLQETREISTATASPRKGKQAQPIESRRKVLFLSHRFPFPPIGGDRVKAYHLLRHLMEIADVDLIALDEAGTAENSRPELSKLHKSTVVPFHKTGAALRILGSLATSTPIEFAYYRSPEMQREVDVALASNSYDLVIAFFLRTAGYLAKPLSAAKLLIAEDARIILQERASEKFELTPQYLVRKLDAGKLKRYEPETMSTGFDKVTFVAKEDESRILAEAPTLPTDILTNGVALEDFPFYAGERKDEILFAGHLGVYHNVLMVERLLKQVFPMIRKLSPATKLLIVGKEPSESMRKLVSATAGAELHPNVPSMLPFLHRAKVFLHPQTVGAGIQNKLLEAMAAGIPVVSTPVGVSGIEGLIDGEHALVRTTDDALAQAAIVLLTNGTIASQLAHSARSMIESRWTWEHVYAKLDSIITELVPDFFESVAMRPVLPRPVVTQ